MKTNTLKITALLLAAGMMICAFSSCRHKENGGDSSEPASDEVVTVDELSDDLFSYQVTIDGHLYSLPCPVSEFYENGWKLYESYNRYEIKPGDPKIIFNLEKTDGSEFSLGMELYNPTAEIIKPSECLAVGVYFDACEEYDVILPGGFAFDSSISYDDIMNQYGQPELIFDEDSYIARYYIQTYYNEIGFSANLDESGNTESIHAHMINRIIENDQSILDRTKIPKVDIANGLESCQVYLEGNLYTLPMTFGEFTSHGWKVKENSYTSYVKDDKELWIGMKTAEELRQPRNDSLITELWIRFDNGFEYAILPGNFIFDKQTTAQEVIAQYGQPDEPIYDYYTHYELIYNLDESGSRYVRFSLSRPDTSPLDPEVREVIICTAPKD